MVNRYRCPVLWDAAGLIEESDAQFWDTYIMNMCQACLQLTSQLHLCVFVSWKAVSGSACPRPGRGKGNEVWWSALGQKGRENEWSWIQHLGTVCGSRWCWQTHFFVDIHCLCGGDGVLGLSQFCPSQVMLAHGILPLAAWIDMSSCSGPTMVGVCGKQIQNTRFRYPITFSHIHASKV